ncbi:gamma-glutamylcyclotransferase [Epibacterium sp. SM1969]|uniref:Gamma-glutamylcyclotransferase n=1 Tax=Tritonibacter aquimaris TaxID=2663379 RepID=A0A844AV87_9RHOB|nr:gamma-glutamylcyclotransferase family protein [Tritonibacter aquimaris]MQY43767.1 gamma-glutamylcyclotransferase [Tritonibacter aquimaris]
MSSPYFFGYGSLVNVATHSYRDTQPARLTGWQRSWVQTEVRDMAFLSVIANPNTAIDGLIAAVPGADWDALDDREFAYERLQASSNVHHKHPRARDIQVYAVPESPYNQIQPAYPVWLSYLDVVVQGYLQVFGEAGVAAFFQSTSGWDRPFIDDRAAPLYPRAQVLSPQEQALVDHYLNQTTAIRTPLE